MNTLLVIDSLGSGGAQRQMVALASGLVARGHSVDLFNYYPQFDFFRSAVVDSGVRVFDYTSKSKGFSVNVLFALRRILQENSYNVAVAFLDSPGIYLTLAGFGTKTRIIVSDRSSYLNQKFWAILLKRQIYRLADMVVANSQDQRNWLVTKAFLPEKQVTSIYNGYQIEKFPFKPIFPVGRDWKIVGIGRVLKVKNLETIISGMLLFYKQNGWCPELTWVGRVDSQDYKNQINRLLALNPEILSRWKWAGEVDDVVSYLDGAHALILASYCEGLPNVVCEAMFAGKPVLVSRVCDNPALVTDGERGFLFSPDSVFELAASIQKLVGLTGCEYLRMAQKCRNYAIENLSLERMVTNYERLFFHDKRDD